MPDGFDHFRRAYVAGTLADVAVTVMPAREARRFRAFIAGLQRAATPLDPPEPPRIRRKKAPRQRALPLPPPPAYAPA